MSRLFTFSLAGRGRSCVHRRRLAASVLRASEKTRGFGVHVNQGVGSGGGLVSTRLMDHVMRGYCNNIYRINIALVSGLRLAGYGDRDCFDIFSTYPLKQDQYEYDNAGILRRRVFRLSQFLFHKNCNRNSWFQITTARIKYINDKENANISNSLVSAYSLFCKKF